MLESAGFEVVARGASSGVLEGTDDDMWRILRSPGVVLPSLQNVGESELRRQVLASVERFGAGDGMSRVVNEITHVIGRKPE